MAEKEPKPDIGPCARCGRMIKNPKTIGSLIIGRGCYKRLILEQQTQEKVVKCPLCHGNLSGEHLMKVGNGVVELVPLHNFRKLDDFAPTKEEESDGKTEDAGAKGSG